MAYINLSTIKTLPSLSFVTDSFVARYSKIKSFSRLHRVCLSSYSYVSNNCCLSRVSVGSYTSIGPRVCTINGLHPYHSSSQSPIFHQPKSSLFKSKNHFPIFSDPNLFQKKGSSNSTLVIEEDVWIGSDVKIMSGVRIGRGCVIGSCTFVNKDVPPYAIAYGVPMKIIRQRFSSEQICELEKSQWWTFPPDIAHSLLRSIDATYT